MKSNEEKLLREKLASLDTLSGGIVYGKEDAWDKLQARLEKKPARAMQLRYWVAAAALLLVFATILTAYFYPAKENRIAKEVENRNPPVSNVTAREQPVVITKQPVAEKNEAFKLPVSHKERKQNHNEQVKEVVAVSVAPLLQAVIATKEEEKPVAHVPAPVTPMPVVMKVVHINDIEHGGISQGKVATLNTPASVAVNQLPVLHINDVERDAVEVKAILRENRMTYGHIPFHRTSYNDGNTVTEEYPQPVNILKIKFNTQN